MRLALAALLAIGFNNAFAQEPEPCTSITSECTEWVSVPDDPSRLLVYRTYPLDTRNEEITRALVMVHGGGRNADDYFRTALMATFLADRLKDTVVIAPRFAANDGENCTDLLAENELNWPCNLYSWRVGSAAINNPNVTSFDTVDELLRDLAGKQAFPNLSSLVVAGHSGGGAFTIYYEMANVVHEQLGIRLAMLPQTPAAKYTWTVFGQQRTLFPTMLRQQCQGICRQTTEMRGLASYHSQMRITALDMTAGPMALRTGPDIAPG